MGINHIYEFRSSEQRKTPEEMSAEILKSLCSIVQQKYQEEVRAAVITVPAAFEQKQCAATTRAAELVGLKACPLVQEPVAAALAYGFQSNAEREYWLVYDFGGGTFDAAVIKADDGVIDVVHHGGHNYLGGADIDWAIVEKIVLPQVAKMGSFPELKRGNPRWENTIMSIKHAIEVAKIELSSSNSTFLMDCTVEDDDGEDIEIDIQLTRDEVRSVAEPIIMESVKICQRVLKEKDLEPTMIRKAILVGGPTLAPYFRDVLSKHLEIPLDYSIDPLTVVAQGAAVFAGGQQFVDDGPVEKGVFDLKVKYNPIGADEDFRIRGKVTLDDESFEGYTICFTNQGTGWNSGQIPLKADGAFKADLIAEAEGRNKFTIELSNPQGVIQTTSLEEIIYTVGAHCADQPVINSLAIEIGDNKADILIEKGISLPARNTKVYKTIQGLRKGESGDLLSIPIIEGENPKADRNRLQGELSIMATDIKRDLPAGSDVEVTLIMDENRGIKAQAFIPVLDEDFEVKIEAESRVVDVSRLNKELKEAREQIDELSKQSGSSSQFNDQKAELDEVSILINIAQNDSVAAGKAEAKLLQLRSDLDKVSNKAQWPMMIEEANKALKELDDTVREYGNNSPDYLRRAKSLRNDVETLIDEKRDDLLPKKTKQVIDLFIEIQLAKPEFWIGIFQFLKGKKAKMGDQMMASRLFEQGDNCINSGNFQQLQQVTAQLLGLLPRDIQEKVKSGGYAKGGTLGL
jgi:molecular chaperone DnaK